MHKKIIRGIVFFITLFYAFMCFAQAKETIHFGVLYFYPPFIYSNKIGFDISLASALCQEMSADCTFQAMSLEDAQKNLKANKIDALISAVSITEDRQKIYNISLPYLVANAGLVGLRHRHYPSTLDGLKIGVVRASTFERYLANTPGLKAQIISYAFAPDSIDALGKAEIDLVLMDAPIADYWVKHSNGRLFFIDDAFVIPFDKGYGILTPKNNTRLVGEINNALKTLVKDGQYAKLFSLYFGMDKEDYVEIPNWMKA